MPPNGRRGSLLTMPFTKTEPASISTAARSICAASLDQKAAPRPNVGWLASAIASSKPATRNSVATGPNSSSSQAVVPRTGSATTVGA